MPKFTHSLVNRSPKPKRKRSDLFRDYTVRPPQGANRSWGPEDEEAERASAAISRKGYNIRTSEHRY